MKYFIKAIKSITISNHLSIKGILFDRSQLKVTLKSRNMIDELT